MKPADTKCYNLACLWLSCSFRSRLALCYHCCLPRGMHSKPWSGDKPSNMGTPQYSCNLSWHVPIPFLWPKAGAPVTTFGQQTATICSCLLVCLLSFHLSPSLPLSPALKLAHCQPRPNCGATAMFCCQHLTSIGRNKPEPGAN